MFTYDLLLGGQLWLLLFIFGLVSLPITNKLFVPLFDKGYFLGKLIGIFVISYVLFLLSSLKVLPLGFNSLLFLSMIWAGVNFFVWRKNKKLDMPWKRAVLEEIILVLLVGLFIFIKGHQPEIYQIERFMDFGFIKALTQTKFLPLEDIWRTGGPLNYYYFGHFLAYVLIVLSKIPIIAGFFVVQCFIFGVSGVLAFIFGATLVSKFNPKVKFSILAGLLSLFATIFAGDWQTLNNAKFWYPDPTRIIPGTISEIPIYSFIVADLHAHVWGFLLGAVILLTLLSIWYQKEKFTPVLAWLSFLLGLCIMTNTWDFLTLGSIVGLTLLFKFRRLLPSVVCLGVGFFLSLPWLINFTPPLGGLGLVTSWSPIVPWLLFWGPSIFLVVLYLLSKIKHKLDFQKEGLILILFFLVIFWLAFLEIFYIKDILSGGEWFRANTYFKVSLQVLLWVGLCTGPVIFILLSKTKGFAKYFVALVLTIWLLTRAVYPIRAVHQSSLENKTYTGLSSGLDFWKTRYPDDFKAYQFLQTQPKGVVLEADGDSYQDTSFFSTFLGWPTVSGWAVHEWTWHGSYDDVGKRAREVKEVYTGKDLNLTKDILKKYNVKYIIIGSAEKRKYAQALDLNKLKKLGKVIYQPNLSSTVVISRQ